jgi:hypothetical protein
MTIVQKEPVYICDICKNEFDKNELHVDECRVSRISMIECEIWYQGHILTKHICKQCSQKILCCMQQIEPKIDWHKWVKR